MSRYTGLENGVSLQPHEYDQIILWGNKSRYAREGDGGFWGPRTKQGAPLVDAYELQLNPNNESFFLQLPDGGGVQFENVIGNVVQDGKRIFQPKSFYRVGELPVFAENNVLSVAQRQLRATGPAGFRLQWVVSDNAAVEH